MTKKDIMKWASSETQKLHLKYDIDTDDYIDTDDTDDEHADPEENSEVDPEQIQSRVLRSRSRVDPESSSVLDQKNGTINPTDWNEWIEKL